MDKGKDIRRLYLLVCCGLPIALGLSCGQVGDDQTAIINDRAAGSLENAESLYIAGRFAEADSLLEKANSAGDTSESVRALRLTNLTAWAWQSSNRGDSSTSAECLRRLAAGPLPDSILLSIGPLADIAYRTWGVTDNIVADYAPRFSADGKKMVFFSRLEREGLEFLARTYAVRYQTQICLMDLTSGKVEVISDGRASEFFPDISSDGQSIVCQRADGDTLKGEWTAAQHSYLYCYDLSTRIGRSLGRDTIFAQCPRFCPSGEEVIFITGMYGDEWLISSLNLKSDSITWRYRYEDIIHSPKPWGVFCPTMLADGRQMVFQAGVLQHKGVFVADELGRNMRRLSPPQSEWNEDVREWHPAVSPDGKRVVFVAESAEGEELFLRPVDGGDRRQITFDGSRKMFPAYFPDGKYIAYSARPPDGDDAEYEIYFLQLADDEYRAQIADYAQEKLRRSKIFIRP